MSRSLNPHISVDCVVFGFEKDALKILLVDRDAQNDANKTPRKKLPGNLIIRHEILQRSAERTLLEYTGLENIYLRQFGVFDNPTRLRPLSDLQWLNETSSMEVDRVVTIAYYSLVNIDEHKRTELSIVYNARWYPFDEIPNLKLIFDHDQIIKEGLQRLRQELITEPLAYNLLPEKFTLNQLQKLYETILGFEIDNRNFRKKISRLDYIIPLTEYQKGVAHKPARLYVFDKVKFEEFNKNYTGFII